MSEGHQLLRKRLTALVYRDVAIAHGLGLLIALLPMIYFVQVWPPSAIRAAIRALETWPRIGLLVVLHFAYLLATHGLVHRLLGSARLAWWRQLPLTNGWWRALHCRHLLLLDAPWLLAAAYGLWPLIGEDRVAAAFAWLFGYAGLTFTAQVALVAGRPWRLALGLGSAVAFLPVLWGGPWVAVLVGAPALAWAVRRLGEPMPEPQHFGHGRWHRGGATIALIRLAARAVMRRNAIALVWGLSLQLSIVVIVAFALARAGARAEALARGLAVVAAAIGAAVLPRAMVLLDDDRAWIESWGVAPSIELRAQLGLAALGGAPALILGTSLTHAHGWQWLLDGGVAIGWAAILATASNAAAEIRRELRKPKIARTLVRITLGVALVSLSGSVLVLIPWALVELVRLPKLHGRAQRTRQRFDVLDIDDHG